MASLICRCVWLGELQTSLQILADVVFFCLFQALEFFLKAEEGKTQHTNRVSGECGEKPADLLLAAAQILRNTKTAPCP